MGFSKLGGERAQTTLGGKERKERHQAILSNVQRHFHLLSDSGEGEVT